MYVTATEPNAIKEVMEAANEKIKAAINTTIDLYFIPSAERAPPSIRWSWRAATPLT